MRIYIAFAVTALLCAIPAEAISQDPGPEQSVLTQLLPNEQLLYRCAFEPDCRLLILHPNGRVSSFYGSSVSPGQRSRFVLWLLQERAKIRRIRVFRPGDPGWDAVLNRYNAQPQKGARLA